MSLDVVETLCGLVSVPSVNPMGRPCAGEEYLEHALTDHLEELFGRLGLPSLRQEVDPGRANILAAVPGDPPPDRGGQLIVFEAHQDTVPVEGMRIPPWTPEVREGRVYGRGACDIKGGMASMLVAISRLAAETPTPRPTIVLACTVNEEHGFSGARALARWWSEGGCPLVPRLPDAVIVAEPTQLNVVVAHKGVVRWRCRTRGRAAHSAEPQRGKNAIYHMARVLLALEAYAHDVVPLEKSHPLVGAPSLSVGVISGGISVNTVPDSCTIEIDRRLLPGEDGEGARTAVRDFIQRRCRGLDVEHEPSFLSISPLSDARNRELGRRLSELARSCEAPGALVGVPYGTDAPAFDALGIPTVVFGPGSIAQAHTDDEWVAVDQLRTAADVYHAVAKNGLGAITH